MYQKTSLSGLRLFFEQGNWLSNKSKNPPYFSPFLVLCFSWSVFLFIRSSVSCPFPMSSVFRYTIYPVTRQLWKWKKRGLETSPPLLPPVHLRGQWRFSNPEKSSQSANLLPGAFKLDFDMLSPFSVSVVRILRSGEQTEPIGTWHVGTAFQRKWILEVTDVSSTNRRFCQSKVPNNILAVPVTRVCAFTRNVTARRMSRRLWGPIRSWQLFSCRCSSPLTFADTLRKDAAIQKLKSPWQEHERLTLSPATLIFLYGRWMVGRRFKMKVTENPPHSRTTRTLQTFPQCLRDVSWPQLPGLKLNRGLRWASDVNDSSARALPIMLSSFRCANPHAITADIFNVTLSRGKLLHLFFIPV